MLIHMCTFRSNLNWSVRTKLSDAGFKGFKVPTLEG